MQCAHYDAIKPPSFFDYPELNAYFLTRDRERCYDDFPRDKHVLEDLDDGDTPEEESPSKQIHFNVSVSKVLSSDYVDQQMD